MFDKNQKEFRKYYIYVRKKIDWDSWKNGIINESFETIRFLSNLRRNVRCSPKCTSRLKQIRPCLLDRIKLEWESQHSFSLRDRENISHFKAQHPKISPTAHKSRSNFRSCERLSAGWVAKKSRFNASPTNGIVKLPSPSANSASWKKLTSCRFYATARSPLSFSTAATNSFNTLLPTWTKFYSNTPSTGI